MASSVIPSLPSLYSSFASSWALGLSSRVVSSFTFSVFILAAIASNSFSRDISSGYMRVLLSYPVRRIRLFLSKILVLLFVPFSVFTCSLLSVAALAYPSLFLHFSLWDMMYILAVMLVQMFFILSVCLSASILIRQPVMSFLASVVTLIGLEQISGSYLCAPYKYLLPTDGTSLLYRLLPSEQVTSQYTLGDFMMPLLGMVIIPAAILIIDLVYFRWRFQT
jgi:ABC-type transport system involved in multi-copper enzyme maturation permease subunit